MPKVRKASIIPLEHVASRIFLVRGHKVMLDTDVAELYGVTTKRLNEQARRNVERFPPDFMFQMNTREYDSLRSQIATSKAQSGRGGRRYLPYVFTEHGALMAAAVLDSERAVRASIYVVRAFVQLREMLSSNKRLAHKLNELERKLTTHDHAITELIEAIRQLMAPPEPKKKHPIGFAPWGKE
ncbi:MAG TPA: ORF6N domain-containing protein [Candidatus Methylomirabilis sp.]|nr:ORF6N domain-containing protein [Candidatus Methylomirabilis sp.]